MASRNLNHLKLGDDCETKQGLSVSEFCEKNLFDDILKALPLLCFILNVRWPRIRSHFMRVSESVSTHQHTSALHTT